MSNSEGLVGRSVSPARVRIDAPGAATVQRVPELDALRGLAALAVVVYHCKERWLPFGWAAVDLFFVLSGYLITAIVLRHGQTAGFLRSFYVRRGLRVWPLYFLVVGVLAALTPVLRAPANWAGLPYVLTFTQNVPRYWSGHAPEFLAYLAHTWTLALEEQFYLVWPALLLLVGSRRVGVVAAACVVGSVCARTAGLEWTLLVSRSDGLAMGGLLAALFAARPALGPAQRYIRGGLGLAAGLGLILVLATHGLGKLAAYPITSPRLGAMVLGFNLLWMGVVGLAAVEAGRPALATLRTPALIWLGRISYGLYLLHHVILCIARDILHASGRWREPAWMLLLTVVVAITAAGLSHAYFEAPILRWKRRFDYGRTPGPRPARHSSPACEGLPR